MMQPTLYLMLGYPGAGKTTTAKMLAELTGATYISSDAQRVKMFPHPSFSETEHANLYNELDREVERLLKTGVSVIYDANLNRNRHRVEKYELAQKYHYQTVLIWLQTPVELAKSRRVNDMSHHHLVPQHEDPATMFERTIRVFEPPHPDESFVLIDGTKVTPDYIKHQLGL